MRANDIRPAVFPGCSKAFTKGDVCGAADEIVRCAMHEHGAKRRMNILACVFSPVIIQAHHTWRERLSTASLFHATVELANDFADSNRVYRR
jgi:hypothetical protein